MDDCEAEKQRLLDNTHNSSPRKGSNSSNSSSSISNMKQQLHNYNSAEATMSDPSLTNPSTPVTNGNDSHTEQYTYEELTSGFTCPTCHGQGKIPRGREADLVALIPYNDARLKPRRTYLYVLLSVLGCAILAGVLCAFLIPRPIYMSINAVETQGVLINQTTSTMTLHLRTEFSITNKNFVPSYGQNATVTAYWSEMVKGTNTTSTPFTIGARQTDVKVYANVTTTFTESFLVTYCSSGSTTHIIYMQFTATLQFKLLSQNQQATKTYYSAVRCAMGD